MLSTDPHNWPSPGLILTHSLIASKAQVMMSCKVYYSCLSHMAAIPVIVSHSFIHRIDIDGRESEHPVFRIRSM